MRPVVTGVVAFRLVDLPTGAGAFTPAKFHGRQVASTSGTVLVSTIGSFATLSALLAWLI